MGNDHRVVPFREWKGCFGFGGFYIDPWRSMCTLEDEHET